MNSRSFCLNNDWEVNNDQAKNIDQGPKGCWSIFLDWSLLTLMVIILKQNDHKNSFVIGYIIYYLNTMKLSSYFFPAFLLVLTSHATGHYYLPHMW